MQPQDAQMMGQVAPAGAMGQQVIIVQNKSGGPKVFGIVAIIFGGLGVIFGLLNFGTDLGELGGGYVALFYVLTAMGIASSGIFAYAGVLLWQYKKSGVWWGFGSIGIAVLSGLIQTFVVASALSDLDETLGEAAAGFGLILVGIQAVCCSMVVALPLLMNGADLD
ncbi:MAG: hypothetical protein HN689_06270 [Euryarchaeota archaeon]|nr:hypothetical protein [Euryarchaeota archaeon]